jgi:IS1 family transposase
MDSMNRLSIEQRIHVIAALGEGNSSRATCRMTGVAKGTVTKLLSDMGTVCSIYMDEVMTDLPCQRLQVDEIWTFVYAKERNVPRGKRGEAGDAWTWVALDPDTKLVPCFAIGPRNAITGGQFLADLAKRLANRVQLTTDAFPTYTGIVGGTFGSDVDYAQLVKMYGTEPGHTPERRYSPGVCIGVESRVKIGNPDPEHISTSFVERQNLTMRMGMRRFTRLTNGFSKKEANLFAAVALHFMHYNFCRKHQTLKGTTPAMAAGLSDHVWTLTELIALLDDAERTPTTRGPYKTTISN